MLAKVMIVLATAAVAGVFCADTDAWARGGGGGRGAGGKSGMSSGWNGRGMQGMNGRSGHGRHFPHQAHRKNDGGHDKNHQAGHGQQMQGVWHKTSGKSDFRRGWQAGGGAVGVGGDVTIGNICQGSFCQGVWYQVTEPKNHSSQSQSQNSRRDGQLGGE